MRCILIALAALAVVVAGCTAAASPSPSPAASPSPPAATSPSPSPAVSPSAPASPSPCPGVDFSSQLESESLTDVTVGADGSTVTFTFGPPDPAWPAGPPEVAVAPATPPFSQGASDLPLEVEGDNHIRVHLTNMKLVDDTGTPLYDGPTTITSQSGPIVAVVQEEAFEGVVNWLIGYDGSGCVTVETSPDGLTLTITIAQ